MIIKDGVYGEFDIQEQVLLDLINSPSIQRLKGISQMGMPQKYWHTPVLSRYEHSIGVMLLLRKLNASLNEQMLDYCTMSPIQLSLTWLIGFLETQQRKTIKTIFLSLSY